MAKYRILWHFEDSGTEIIYAPDIESALEQFREIKLEKLFGYSDNDSDVVRIDEIKWE